MGVSDTAAFRDAFFSAGRRDEQDGSYGMTGHEYIARARLTNKAGDVVFAEVGETCERVPAASLPWLIEQGLVSAAPMVPAFTEMSEPEPEEVD
jgi:hypothetical protein